MNSVRAKNTGANLCSHYQWALLRDCPTPAHCLSNTQLPRSGGEAAVGAHLLIGKAKRWTWKKLWRRGCFSALVGSCTLAEETRKDGGMDGSRAAATVLTDAGGAAVLPRLCDSVPLHVRQKALKKGGGAGSKGRVAAGR